MARYIDAEKINYAICSVYWSKDENGKDIYRRTAIAVEREIDEIPTADVAEVKHGEWELGESGCMYICSSCGYAAHPREVDEWNYCPICGAKMDGGK